MPVASAPEPTRIELPYGPRVHQKLVHQALKAKRFLVLVTHRRFGKTVLAVNHQIRSALTCRKERPRFGFISPTYTQGKATSFDYFTHYSQPIPGLKVNQSELRVDYPNGSQCRIYGADNPDNLRGLYFDGVVLEEYGLHQAKTFSEVIGPTLVDRGGSALFLGTPNGKNQFYEMAMHARTRAAADDPEWGYLEFKASETGILDAAYLQAARDVMTSDEYQQEFECSFEASVKGAIYAKELEAARLAQRITEVPVDPVLPVDTDWDLGIGDAMCVWFSQTVKGSGQVRLIDYYEASGEGFPHFVQVLREKRYTYGTHWAPHDIAVRELGSGKSRLEVAAGLGLKFSITPRVSSAVGQELEDGIHAVRLLLPRCWFDATRCRRGLEALGQYRRDYNSRLDEFKATPVHDAASHGADAFRGLAVRHQVPKEPARFDSGLMPGSAHGWMA